MFKFRITTDREKVTDTNAVPDQVDSFNRNLVRELCAQRQAGEGDLEIECGIKETVFCHRLLKCINLKRFKPSMDLSRAINN